MTVSWILGGQQTVYYTKGKIVFMHKEKKNTILQLHININIKRQCHKNTSKIPQKAGKSVLSR